MADKVVGLGAGGHARGVMEMLLSVQEYFLVGMTDPQKNLHGTEICGIPVLGDDDTLRDLRKQGVHRFFIGIGGTGDNTARKNAYHLAVSFGLQAVTLIHPRAVVSNAALLGKGCTIMPGAIINAGVELGENVLINSGAIIEHDCRIGDHAHVASGACLAGDVAIGAEAHIGSGSVILQGLEVGRRAIVGAGSVVTKGVPPAAVVYGNPARNRRTRRPG